MEFQYYEKAIIMHLFNYFNICFAKHGNLLCVPYSTYDILR